MRMLFGLVEDRKSVQCSHFDFIVDLQLRKINATIALTEFLLANAILIIPNYAIFIKKKH